MNIFERIKIRYYISKKYTFRVHVGEYHKNRKCYKEKILKKKGFVKAKIVDGFYIIWCNPDRIKKIKDADVELYADNEVYTTVVNNGVSPYLCLKCVENKKCKKYLDFLERSAQNESNGNN